MVPQGSPATPITLANQAMFRLLNCEGVEAVLQFSVNERRFTFEAACRCVDDCGKKKDPPPDHIQFFKADRYQILRSALCLTGDTSRDDGTPTSASCSTATEFNCTDSPGSVDSKGRKVAHWIKTTVKAMKIPSNPRLSRGSPGLSQPEGSESSNLTTDEQRYTFHGISIERAFEILLAAAPKTGQVQHWMWLLQAFSERCCIASGHQRLAYLESVRDQITSDLPWLKLLLHELMPYYSQTNDRSADSAAISFTGGCNVAGEVDDSLQTVTRQALQVAEQAITNFRNNYTTVKANGEMLAVAVKLIHTVYRDTVGVSAHVENVLQDRMGHVATMRFKTLKDKIINKNLAECDKDVSNTLRLGHMTELVTQLTMDVMDDAAHYNAAFPPACNISLPSISCRFYCCLLKPELEAILAEDLPLNSAFFTFFSAVRKLEDLAEKWLLDVGSTTECPFVDDDGQPLFLRHVDKWFGLTRTRLLSASTTALDKETWSLQGDHKLRCTRSVIDLYHLLRVVVERAAVVISANQKYALLCERTISRAVLNHAEGLERLALAELPSALRCGTRNSCSSPLSVTFHASNKLCMCINDLRELRSRQADIATLMKRHLPAEWWGNNAVNKSTNSINTKKSAERREGYIGDRLRLCQGEIERRYTMILRQLVARITINLPACVKNVLSEPDTDEAALMYCLQPVTTCIDAALNHLAPQLDIRVVNRITKELWSTTARVLHEELSAEQGQENRSIYNSTDNIAPRIRAADAALKYFSSYFTTVPYALLKKSDEPEKARQLGKMLAFFLREDTGDSVECSSPRTFMS